MTSTSTLTTLIWDWFTGEGRAHVTDHEGVGGAAEWHLLHECSIDTTSSVPTPGVTFRDETMVVGTFATGVGCTCGKFVSETLVSGMIMPLADLLSRAAETETQTDASAAQVFVVTSCDDEGHTTLQGAFSDAATAEQYAAQFTPDWSGRSTADVTPMTIETVAPHRYTHYSLTQMFSTESAASVGRTIGSSVLRPIVEQFDEDDPRQYSETRPFTTEPVKVSIEQAPSLWRVVYVHGTDEEQVKAKFKEACAQVVAEAAGI